MINLDNIKESNIITVAMVRDIRKVYFRSKEEQRKLKGGTPDVITESPLGVRSAITRHELAVMFRTLNNGKIKLHKMGYGKKYMVMANVNNMCYAVNIPAKLKFETEINGRKLKVNQGNNGNGDYIIWFSNEDGSRDTSNAFVVKDKYFKRMFKVVEFNREVKEAIVSNTANKQRENIEKVAVNKEIRKENIVKQEMTVTSAVYKDNKLIGFEISDGKQIKVLNKTQLMHVCQKYGVSNMGVRSLNGKNYLHGIGVRIEDLKRIDV